MSKVVIFIAPNEIRRAAYDKDMVQQATQAFMMGQYDARGTVLVTETDPMDACEEIFDLTNNPSRQAERERKYGRWSSVSVADILSVDGIKFICLSIGYHEIGPCDGAIV